MSKTPRRPLKKRYFPLFIIALLLIIYFAGPKPYYEIPSDTPPLDWNLQNLEANITAYENRFNLKEDNEARIVWADSVRKTAFSIVYLHGFSASPMESRPIHTDFAKEYGANIYLARIAGHGIDDDGSSLANTNPKEMIRSAQQAIQIGKLLGEKVIVMACSTGATLGLYAAALDTTAVDAFILYSPNIALHDKKSAMLTRPWGKHLARGIIGDYRDISALMPESTYDYWTVRYPVEAVVKLRYLVEHTMTKATFARIRQPLFLGYYYKNEKEKDKTISIQAARQFFDFIPTPSHSKQEVAFADVAAHVLASDLQSEDLASVRKATYAFGEEILGMKKYSE